jgi:hypothetical protein
VNLVALAILFVSGGAALIGLGHLIPGRGWVIAGTVCAAVAWTLSVLLLVGGNV